MNNTNKLMYFDLLFSALKGLYLDYQEETDLLKLYFSENLEDEESNYSVPKNLTLNNFSKILKEVEGLFEKKNRRPCIFLCDEGQEEIKFKEYLLSLGYKERNLMDYLQACNYKEDENISKNISKNNCEIILVNDNNKYIEDYMKIYEECFLQECSELEAEQTVELMLETFNKSSKFHNYILIKNNVPIAISSISIWDNYANLYNVATRQEYRKQNFSKMIMGECLKSVRRKEKILIQSAYLDKYVLNIGFEKMFSGAMYVKK